MAFTPITQFTAEIAKATKVFESAEALEYAYRGIDIEVVPASAAAPKLWYIRMDKDYTNFNYFLATTDNELAIWNALNPAGAGEAEEEFTASTFEQDDTKVGGAECKVAFEGLTATVTGTIAYIPAEPAWGQVAANRVGFKITPSTSLQNYADVKAYVGEKVYGIADFNYRNDKNVLIWLPIVSMPGQTIIMLIDWDGVHKEQFTVKIDSTVKLQTKEEYEASLKA